MRFAAVFTLGTFLASPVQAKRFQFIVDKTLESDTRPARLDEASESKWANASWRTESQESGEWHEIYAIGDTHGDRGFLKNMLLSTGKFVIGADQQLFWRTNLPDRKFEVIMLGDYIDRGTHSLENLELLKRLKEDDEYGKHLVVLLGNHESMLLRYDQKNIEKYGQDDIERWTDIHRQKAWIAPSSSNDEDWEVSIRGYAILKWLRDLPVVHFSHGSFFMHGGLTNEVARELVSLTQDKGNGAAIADYMNKEARHFYHKVSDCVAKAEVFQDVKSAKKCGKKPQMDHDLKPPFFLSTHMSGKSAQSGILWFRGYTEFNDLWKRNRNPLIAALGIGGKNTCPMAAEVGELTGAYNLVMAHSTHPKIHRGCSEDQVWTYAIDVHNDRCLDGDDSDHECDAWAKHAQRTGQNFSAESLLLRFRNDFTIRGNFEDMRCNCQVSEKEARRQKRRARRQKRRRRRRRRRGEVEVEPTCQQHCEPIKPRESPRPIPDFFTLHDWNAQKEKETDRRCCCDADEYNYNCFLLSGTVLSGGKCPKKFPVHNGTQWTKRKLRHYSNTGMGTCVVASQPTAHFLGRDDDAVEIFDPKSREASTKSRCCCDTRGLNEYDNAFQMQGLCMFFPRHMLTKIGGKCPKMPLQDVAGAWGSWENVHLRHFKNDCKVPSKMAGLSSDLVKFSS